jgi:hypothetical protein
MYPTLIYPKHGTNNYFYSIPSDSSIPVSIDRPINSLWDTALIPAFLESTDTYYQKLLGPIIAYSSFPLQQIVDDIISGSNGSFDGTTGTGTFGWVLATTDRHVCFGNASPFDCHPDMNSSYRAELSGLLAVSYLLTGICTHHWILTGNVTLYCDHKGAICNVFIRRNLVSPFMKSDYDIIHLTKQILKSLPVKLTGQWVNGHSTAKMKSVQEELNIIADGLAGDYASAPHPRHRPSRLPLPPPTFTIHVLYDRSVITSRLYRTLATCLYRKSLTNYILQKTGWSQRVIDMVNWDVHGQAFCRLSRQQKISTTKLLHKLINTNCQNRIYYGTSDLCPCCGIHEESFHHLLTCPDLSMVDCQEKA